MIGFARDVINISPGEVIQSHRHNFCISDVKSEISVLYQPGEHIASVQHVQPGGETVTL